MEEKPHGTHLFPWEDILRARGSWIQLRAPCATSDVGCSSDCEREWLQGCRAASEERAKLWTGARCEQGRQGAREQPGACVGDILRPVLQFVWEVRNREMIVSFLCPWGKEKNPLSWVLVDRYWGTDTSQRSRIICPGKPGDPFQSESLPRTDTALSCIQGNVEHYHFALQLSPRETEQMRRFPSPRGQGGNRPSWLIPFSHTSHSPCLSLLLSILARGFGISSTKRQKEKWFCFFSEMSLHFLQIPFVCILPSWRA